MVLILTDRVGRLAATVVLLASMFPSRVLAAPLAAAGPRRLDGIQRIRLAGPSAGLAAAAFRHARSVLPAVDDPVLTSTSFHKLGT